MGVEMADEERWNELNLSENPAIELFKKLGYEYAPPEALDAERAGLKDVVLAGRLCRAIKKLNPWISDDNVKKVARKFTHVTASGPVEANEKVHTALVRYVSIEQDRGSGKKSQTVRVIDFDRPERNEFLVTSQFKVAGPKENIKPDLAVFVNGLPLGVIECKSPTITDPVVKGVRQLIRYQDARIGAPQLFECNQVLATLCGQAAKYCSVGGEHRHFLEWRDPFPKKMDEVRALVGRKPNPQDILLAGMFAKEHFLDLVQNFIVFEAEHGRLIKKLARYQQFRAVNKEMTQLVAEEFGGKGGVVWHTQGSGKSLTMLWMAVKLRRIKKFENPVIVIVTDRIDLNDQILRTFGRCGFPNPVEAKGVEDLRTKLRSGPGLTVMTTIQKFETVEREKEGSYPVLSEDRNIFVLVDEAHRTQYKNLATNMRTGLPNACFIGFTGTPIDKRDRSTQKTFGPYIDTYTIEQSVEDEATVPIFYEGRLPKVHVAGANLDEIFDRMFSDYSEKTREEIKKRYANEQAIAGARERVEQVCLDIIRHFEVHVRPNGFKAQIVTVDRRTAVLFKETLDKLHGPESAVIISKSADDDEVLRKYHTNKDQQRKLRERFLKPMDKDALSILIVCDMLLTGFDAPIEQVMYLDSPLREHNLLQAIARVNRPYEGKSYGLIVDYYGVSDFLKEALAVFRDADIKGALTSLKEELPRLQTRHRAAMRFFEGVRREDMEACIHVLEKEDVRVQFDVAFKRFADSMDRVMPDPAANPYREDLKLLGAVRNAARTRFRDEQFDLAGCSEKVRKLVEEHIRATGVDPLIKPVSILSKDFQKQVDELKSDEARASEMEHAIRHEISIRFEENPEFYTSLRARLEEIIREKEQERLSMARVVEELGDIVRKVKDEKGAARDAGFEDKTEYAVYGILKAEVGDGVLEEEIYKATAKQCILEIKEEAVIDWPGKDDVQRVMRQRVKRALRSRKVPADKIEAVTYRIMDLARVRLRK